MAWGAGWAGQWSGGAAPGSAFAFSAVRATGARAIRVTFTREPVFLSPIGRYDAGNVQRWTLTRQDTGRVIPLLGISPVSGDSFSVELVMAEPFASSPLIVYELVASQILATTGVFLVDPSTAELAGMPQVRDTTERPRPLVDLYNPQVDRQALRGALQVGTNGDYVLEDGVGLLRKLIVRRLLTAIDEYYHLAGTSYGAGLQPKQLLRPGDLVVLRTQLEAEVLREPEVAGASLSLALATNGRLDVRASILLRTTNQSLTLSFPFEPS